MATYMLLIRVEDTKHYLKTLTNTDKFDRDLRYAMNGEGQWKLAGCRQAAIERR